jgi:hypothetical protein
VDLTEDEDKEDFAEVEEDQSFVIIAINQGIWSGTARILSWHAPIAEHWAM